LYNNSKRKRPESDTKSTRNDKLIPQKLNFWGQSGEFNPQFFKFFLTYPMAFKGCFVHFLRKNAKSGESGDKKIKN